MSGTDVTSWQNFLRGLTPGGLIEVNGTFDDATKTATQTFQRAVSITADGEVGPMTMGKAMSLGYNTMIDSRADKTGQNWPTKPGFDPMSFVNKVKIFGAFSYVSAPTSWNPEAITITDDWVSNNIVTISIPQLARLNSEQVQLHKLIAQQTQTLFQAWDDAGLCEKILTWGGSWAPRFIRGSRTVLSNHAWGTAFDINVQWNMLGTIPTKVGQRGSVRELVNIANDNGFYWGGHFSTRPDGMHFEAAIVLVSVTCGFTD